MRAADSYHEPRAITGPVDVPPAPRRSSPSPLRLQDAFGISSAGHEGKSRASADR